MTKRARFDWKRHLPEIRTMLANGATGADVARHYGLDYTAALSGIRYHGLKIDPEASNAARRAQGRKMARDPRIRAIRAENTRRAMQDPERRALAARVMTRLQQDKGFRRKARAASQRPDVRAQCREALDAWNRQRMAWCPPHLLEVYRELRAKGLLAAEARAALKDDIAKFRATHEGQLWLIATGQARIINKAIYRESAQ